MLKGCIERTISLYFCAIRFQWINLECVLVICFQKVRRPLHYPLVPDSKSIMNRQVAKLLKMSSQSTELITSLHLQLLLNSPCYFGNVWDSNHLNWGLYGSIVFDVSWFCKYRDLFATFFPAKTYFSNNESDIRYIFYSSPVLQFLRVSLLLVRSV